MALKKTTVKPRSFDLRVKRSRAGLGLFTMEPIKKGACIVEYTGRRLSTKEHYTSRSKYIFIVSDRKRIDGAVRQNRARYINHSCRPNCEIDIARGHVWVRAMRSIRAGEELSYDYDTEYFDRYIKPKGCRCLKCKPL
ncbi:MAG: SET domain-containing protein-lysine N-methyltransferase [bacterium]|nr:SET domain-containing protein-lysine N-methyltransferase [bacterium]